MKIKLAYPKIPSTLNCPLKECIAFEKIDGTCMAFYWSPQIGLHAFGTRRDRFTYSDAGFAEFDRAHPGMDGLTDAIDQDLLYPSGDPESLPDQDIVMFAEFHGEHSFAGSHNPKDRKRLTVFDVQEGGVMVSPQDFVKDYQAFPQPQIVFQGKFTGQLYADVRAGKYPVKEGVVVKGMVDNQVYMAKIKTQAYLDKLREKFGDKWQEYGE